MDMRVRDHTLVGTDIDVEKEGDKGRNHIPGVPIRVIFKSVSAITLLTPKSITFATKLSVTWNIQIQISKGRYKQTTPSNKQVYLIHRRDDCSRITYQEVGRFDIPMNNILTM